MPSYAAVTTAIQCIHYSVGLNSDSLVFVHCTTFLLDIQQYAAEVMRLGYSWIIKN